MRALWRFESMAARGHTAYMCKSKIISDFVCVRKYMYKEPNTDYSCAGPFWIGRWVCGLSVKGQRWSLGFILLWLEISVNYAQVVQMVEGQGQLCKVEFHIFLCKHNLIRTGQIYSLNSEEERKISSKEKKNTTSILSVSNHKQRKQSIIIVTISTFQIGYTIQQAVDLTLPAAIALVLRHAFNTRSV